MGLCAWRLDFQRVHVSTMSLSAFFAYGALLTLASGTVYVGSLASLRTPEATKALRKEKGLKETDDDEEEVQGVSSEGAWMFPLLGSAVLVSLFLAFKYLDKEMIILIVNIYFAVVGCLAIPPVLLHLCKMAFGSHSLDWCTKRALSFKGHVSWTTPSTKKNLYDTVIKLDSATMGLFVVVVVLMAIYMYTKHWVLANIIAVCFAMQGLSLILLDSFQTGLILLGGLFLYDIFWVFGSSKFAGQSVMVSVATNFDGPIKILAPRNLLEVLSSVQEKGWTAADAFQFSLLGLGDIVVPGAFAALALAFDQHHASTKARSLTFNRFFYKFPKPYFHACMVGYVLGLFTTMVVMHIFKTGQPALLYLSPSCSLSVLFVAWYRGELLDMWSWVSPASQGAPKTAPDDKKQA